MPGVLSDRQIRDLCVHKKMITPFSDSQMVKGKISWGLSSYGYDLRVARYFKVFDNPLKTFGRIVDPKDKSWHEGFTDIHNDFCLIPPNSFALAESVEVVKIPRDIMVVCVGKSTYARCGIVVNITPLEPEWEGKVTIEISNTTPLPAKIWAEEGICQALFFSGDDVCERSYLDKSGRYQNQTGLTLPNTRTE